jgi:hypothetical protein
MKGKGEMKKRLAIVAAVFGALNLFAVAPAGAASCTVIAEDLGCTERILCAPGAKLGWECIH